MVSIEVKVTDNGLIDAYDELLLEFPEYTYSVTKNTVNNLAPEMLTDFREEPGPPKRPHEWTSDRQRRYVMMQIARGKINPRRTHKHSQAWKYEVIYRPGLLTSVEVYNIEPGIEFIEGSRQQKWLAETGWFAAKDVAELWTDELEDRIEEDLIIGFDNYGRW